MSSDTTGDIQMANAGLTPYMAAAKLHCQMEGVDPDGFFKAPHPVFEGMTVTMPNWIPAAERMFDLSKLLTAMKRAGGIPAAPMPGPKLVVDNG